MRGLGVRITRHWCRPAKNSFTVINSFKIIIKELVGREQNHVFKAEHLTTSQHALFYKNTETRSGFGSRDGLWFQAYAGPEAVLTARAVSPLPPGPVLAQMKDMAIWNGWAPSGLPSPTPSVSLSPAGTGLRHGALQAAAQPQAPAVPGRPLHPGPHSGRHTLSGLCAAGRHLPTLSRALQPRSAVGRALEAGLRRGGRRG